MCLAKLNIKEEKLLALPYWLRRVSSAEKTSNNIRNSFCNLALLGLSMLDVEKPDTCRVPYPQRGHISDVYFTPNQGCEPNDWRIGPLEEKSEWHITSRRSQQTEKRLGAKGDGLGRICSKFALRSRSVTAVLAFEPLNEACSSCTLGRSSEHIRRMGSRGKLYGNFGQRYMRKNN